MKIYFTASISQGKQKGLVQYYDRINKLLAKQGYKVFSGSLFVGNEQKLEEDSKERLKWYKNCVQEIAKADIVIAEISYPSSANVGHEVSVALERGKPVIAMYYEGKEPVFLLGREDEKLLLVDYNETNLEENLKAALQDADQEMDVRFNFFVSPNIVSYLDWIAKKRRMPRAVYLRRLIEADMAKNKEFLSE